MDSRAEPILRGDTGKIEAEDYLEDGVTPAASDSALLTYRRPDDTITTIGPVVISPAGGSVTFNIPSSETDLTGPYIGKATFTRVDGSIKSVAVTWDVQDPLEVATTDLDKTLDLVWMMFEDAYDSEEGGPYITDTSYFDKAKMEMFVEMALMRINLIPPTQAFTSDNFPYTTSSPLLAKAVEIEVIKHLMRSYVEQPALLGGNASYFDRRDYLQRWQTLLQIEEEQFGHWIKLFKRGAYGLGKGSLLIDLKSGRRQIYPPSARARGRFF